MLSAIYHEAFDKGTLTHHARGFPHPTRKLTMPHVSISHIELSNTDHSVLKVVIGLLAKNGVKAEILDKSDTTGSVMIVDIDTPVGKTFYETFTDRKRALLLLTHETVNDQRHIVLKKPVRVQTLRDVLLDVSVNTGSTPTSPSKNKTADTTEATVKVNFKETLFFTLLKAKQEKQITQIFCPPYSPLFVNPEKGIIATTASREILRKITRNQTGPVKDTKVSDADFEILSKGQLIIPLENILWSAALYGSQGQLVAGHTADMPVQMKAWPNFSRLEFEPEHMKMTTIMTSSPLTLKQLAEKTKVPWEKVVGFYNAAMATGLIILNPTNLPITTTKSTVAKSGLFSKIAQRLKIAS
jgi:hypothetical protein